MATKKKPAAPVAARVDVPSVLLSDEYNKSIARYKMALAKKWSLTRPESLEDTAQLAWSLVAIHRADEARELAEHVCERVTFADDARAWSAAAQTIALAARLARLKNDEARRATLVARLVEHPGFAWTSREALMKHVADADKDIRSGEVESAQKYACQGFARGCARAGYFRETAAESRYEAGTIDIEALERTIAEGLQGLRAHLAR